MIKRRRKKGLGTQRGRGDTVIRIAGKNYFRHVLIAEKALGRPLPPGACVHHADGDPTNDANDNLVICPNQAYHSLIHVRMRAAAACGNPNWRKCRRCHKFDAPENLAIYGNEAVHRACNVAHVRKYK